MTEANGMIQNHLLQLYNAQPEETKKYWSCSPLDIFYDYQKSEFTFSVTQPLFILRFNSRNLASSEDWDAFTGTTTMDFCSIGSGYDPQFDTSGETPLVMDAVQGSNYHYDDWITRTTSTDHVYNPRIWFANAELWERHGLDADDQIWGIKQLKIKNVWGRERMIVKSDLDPYEEYLGYTNTTYGPPKQFPLNKHNSTFWIELYDAVSRQHVIMPEDGKDTVVLEAQFIAQ
jgi:hypothetical protein